MYMYSILFLKNWRPISLLNVDYKIITKELAMRLKQVLPEIIHSDQTANIKDRNITDTLRKLIDIIDYTKANHIQGILIAVDFEKAFDSLEWNFIFKTLEVFNFRKRIHPLDTNPL